MITYRTYPALLTGTILLTSFSVSNILTALWPQICWIPRVGGILVGISVFIHGYIHVNKDKFDTPWRWGLSRDQIYTHVANILAIMGTSMGVFGDLLPKILWVANCACTKCY